jgi:CHAT domain-containing protein
VADAACRLADARKALLEARALKEAKQYTQALPKLEHALKLREAVFGETPEVAECLDELSDVYHRQGEEKRAELSFQRALAVREAFFNRRSTYVNASLERVQSHLVHDHLTEALSLLARHLITSENNLRWRVAGISDEDLANILLRLRTDEGILYSLASTYSADSRVRYLALSAALLRKGRSLDEISNTSRIIYRSLGQKERAKFDRLRALRVQLSALSLTGPGNLSAAHYQQRLKDMAQQGEALEAELSWSSAQLRALPPPSELIGRVAAALPKDGALVELVAYNKISLVTKPSSSASQAPSQLHYLAFLLFADGRTHVLDLGPAAPLDAAALRMHAALAGNAESFTPAAQALYELAFHPLTPLLGKVQRLFLSPDGQLSLVPFAALHNGHRFLVDVFDITYLTSGKELLPRPADLPPARSVVVLADPDFSASPITPSLPTEAASALSQRSASLERFFSSVRSELADQPWPPLPGTRQEAEAIQRLLPQAQLLLGPAATKKALLKLPTPGVLHIATHGFFLEDASGSPATRAVHSIGAVAEAGPLQPPSNPLLRSGLLLAGARSSATQSGSPHSEDSWVTALEMAGLDLWGTQLVVLSACDTGRGDVKLGQGVYGLRRALVVAGAETVVTSLWKVNDKTTQELMEAYYHQLLKGQGRATALRQAMLALRRKRPHPHFWAPFIAIGRDAPLQGLTPHAATLQTP